MPEPLISDEDFISLWRDEGPTVLARRCKINLRSIFYRRRRIEKKYNTRLDTPNPDKAHDTPVYHPHSDRATFQIRDGIVLVGSDLHAWPGPQPVAFRAFMQFCRSMSPAAVVMNGDVIDGAGISRHPPLGWEKLPTLIEEIETAQAWLQDVLLAVPQSTQLFWPAGNHDARFSIRLASIAPEYAKIHGTRLQDHFGERWTPCWSIWINDEVVVKHRAKGGIHAVHNNAVQSGKSMVTGHLHSLKVTPWSDYTGTRYGVDTGCLADTYGPQFRYIEDNPRNWRSGFVVLSFVNGELMWPEVVAAVDETHVQFRGELLEIPMSDDYAKKRVIRDVTEVQMMKPKSAKKKRPVIVVKRSTMKRRHYARSDR